MSRITTLLSEKGERMKKYRFFIIAVLIILGVAAYIIYPRQVHQEPIVRQDALVFPIQRSEKSDFINTKHYIGTVEAIQSVDVVPYLSGFLTQVLVQAGAFVEQGQPLFILDQRIPEANLNQAKEMASQTYATRANAESFYNRMKKTAAKAVSPSDLEQAKTAFEAADAAYQKSLAAQNQAQTLYDYTVIKAPISGWVGNVTATVGEYLSPEGKNLATIIGYTPIRLVFSVPMSQYDRKYAFDDATLQIVSGRDEPIELADFKVVPNNQIDPTTDSLSFFIDIPNVDRRLLPGAYVEVRFLHRESGILADKNWVVLTPDGAVLFVLDNGVVSKRDVKIGAPIGNQYWITAGVNEGEDIITVPVSASQIGQPAKGVVR